MQKVMIFIPHKNKYPAEELVQHAMNKEPIGLTGFQYYEDRGLLRRTDVKEHNAIGAMVLFKDYEKVFRILDQYYQSQNIAYVKRPVLYDAASGYQLQGYFVSKLYDEWAKMMAHGGENYRHIIIPWRTFEGFSKWVQREGRYKEGMKLFKWGRTYSPRACKFVSQENYLNMMKGKK